jgi:aspartyl-tRNA(Asn)/glutamyl-tRNA(Gln) amidotransferase subunit C
MKLTKTQVEQVATLARLELSEQEVGRYSQDLTAILEYVDQLKKTNTEGVLPTYHVGPSTGELREDEVRPSFKREDLLSGAPDHDDRSIRVPQIIEAS